MGTLLANKIFISTRPSGQSVELENLLAEESATLISMPTIEIKSLPLSEKDLEQLKNLENFNWVVFTSPNGLRYFFNALFSIQNHYGLPANLKIAVVGKKTAAHLECYGTSASFINLGNTAEDFVNDFFHRVNAGDRVLFPVGNLARNVIEDRISVKATCTRILFYETLAPETIDNNALQLIIDNLYDMIVLASPSAFTNLYDLIAQKVNPERLRLVCIGQTTASEVIRNGVEPLITAGTANSQGIFTSILNHFTNKS